MQLYQKLSPCCDLRKMAPATIIRYLQVHSENAMDDAYGYWSSGAVLAELTNASLSLRIRSRLLVALQVQIRTD